MTLRQMSVVAVCAAMVLSAASEVSAVRCTRQQLVRLETSQSWYQLLVWNFGTGTGSAGQIQDGTSNTIAIAEIDVPPDVHIGVYPYSYAAGGFTDSLYFLSVGD